MARPETRLDPADGPVAAFAAQLRALRRATGVSTSNARTARPLGYRALAQRSRYSATALSKAAAGAKLPGWDLAWAYIHACDPTADKSVWRARWEAAGREVGSTDGIEALGKPQPNTAEVRPSPTSGPRSLIRSTTMPDRQGSQGLHDDRSPGVQSARPADTELQTRAGPAEAAVAQIRRVDWYGGESGTGTPESQNPQWERAVQKLWDDLDELRRFRGSPTLHALADTVGIPASTLHDWWRRRATVPDWYPFAKLVECLGGDKDEWTSRWRQARSAYDRLRRARPQQPAASPVVGIPQGTSQSPAANNDNGGGHDAIARQRPCPRWRAWPPSMRRILPAALTIILVVSTAMLVMATSYKAQPSRPAQVWHANITNTRSTTDDLYVGVYGYANPTTSERSGPGYPEGTTITIVCQEQHGRLVTDQTAGRSSTVWFKLDDGSWVPDLYTTLANADGNTPVPGIPICH